MTFPEQKDYARENPIRGCAVALVITAAFVGLGVFACSVLHREPAEAVSAPSDVVAAINRQVNRTPVHLDASLNDGRWDCEDFAFAKLEALERAGVSGAVVWRVVLPDGVHHAVVVLPNGRVMDNLFSNMPTRSELERVNGYRFIAPLADFRRPTPTYWQAVFSGAGR